MCLTQRRDIDRCVDRDESMLDDKDEMYVAEGYVVGINSGFKYS